MEIKVLKNIMERNEDLAAENRRLFAEYKIFVLNMMSSPGAGKTAILEQAIPRLKDRFNMAVIEGDLMTSRDAERISFHEVPVVQINTESSCHLDAGMVNRAVEELELNDLDLIFIENVGNLVCPGTFDLGEHVKIVVLSVTEGDDKPAKYPLMFQESRACILNKIDLLPHTNFDLDRFYKDVSDMNADIEIFQTAAVTGQGIDRWCRWLEELVTAKNGS
ncbi:MAG: hydrogenase nickel incorporation protein HypB [Thermoanaerobacteraceae bacterium]|nr:hydrogenase nickel incorporation protein HypB [Thermoanaerobacteraceae bacterium]